MVAARIVSPKKNLPLRRCFLTHIYLLSYKQCGSNATLADFNLFIEQGATAEIHKLFDCRITLTIKSSGKDFKVFGLLWVGLRFSRTNENNVIRLYGLLLTIANLT